MRKISKQLIEIRHTTQLSWQNFHTLKLTVVILSSDKVSGVSDDEVLRRCAVFLIFLFAACTMLATNRDELSRCESLLIAEIGRVYCEEGFIEFMSAPKASSA